jgi:hypothetical protein
LGYVEGVSRVSRAAHNWLCRVPECRNCATTPGCLPGAGAVNCPWGDVWTDLGPCL